jgi:hypothetical protein
MKSSNSNKIMDAKQLFDPTLFWDAENIDIKRHSDYVIARVLDFGDEKDLKKLREIFSDDDLISVLRKRRGLLPMTRRYWSLYFGVDLKEGRDV